MEESGESLGTTAQPKKGNNKDSELSLGEKLHGTLEKAEISEGKCQAASAPHLPSRTHLLAKLPQRFPFSSPRLGKVIYLTVLARQGSKEYEL